MQTSSDPKLFYYENAVLIAEIDPDSVLDGEEWELVSFSQVEHDHPKKFVYEHKVFGEVEITRPVSWRAPLAGQCACP